MAREQVRANSLKLIVVVVVVRVLIDVAPVVAAVVAAVGHAASAACRRPNVHILAIAVGGCTGKRKWLCGGH
eukprot:245276-Pyramimonas_sp.AAC.1